MKYVLICENDIKDRNVDANALMELYCSNYSKKGKIFGTSHEHCFFVFGVSNLKILAFETPAASVLSFLFRITLGFKIFNLKSICD